MIETLDIQTATTTTALPSIAAHAHWTPTNCRVPIKPKTPFSIFRIDWDGPVQQNGFQIIPRVQIMRGGTPIGPPSNAGWSVQSPLNIYPGSGHVFDAPATTEEVVYALAVRNSDPGGSIIFPSQFGSARITATEVSACGGDVQQNTLALHDDVAFSGGVINQIMQYSTAGRVQVPAAINGKTLVLACFGQSMAINCGPTAYTPVNANAHAFNPYDGLIYRAKDPEIGTWTIGGGHNYLTRLADALITDGKFARVILMPNAIGSSSVLDWAPAGSLNQRVRVAALRIMDFGWHQNFDVSLGVIWDHGHAETAFGTTSAQYQEHFKKVQNTMVGLGLNVPWFICVNSYAAGTTNPEMTAANAALVDASKNRFAGANTDSIAARWDGVHMNDAGLIANANMWAAILEAHYA